MLGVFGYWWLVFTFTHLYPQSHRPTYLPRRRQRKARGRPALDADDALVLVLQRWLLLGRLPAPGPAALLLPGVGGDGGLGLLGERGVAGEEELEGLFGIWVLGLVDGWWRQEGNMLKVYVGTCM